MRFPRGKQVVSAVTSQETQEVFADGTDLVLDSVVDSGALEQIPIFGAFLKLYRASQSVREDLFLRRLAGFLREASKMNEDERQRFAEEFQDPDKADRFGETMITLVEKAEDFDKPGIFGRLLVACAKGHFDVSYLTRLCKMVNRAFTEDFQYLKNRHTREQPHRLDPDVEQSLSSAGFLRIVVPDGSMSEPAYDNEAEYVITEYGKRLVELGLSEGPVPEYVPTPDLFGLNNR